MQDGMPLRVAEPMQLPLWGEDQVLEDPDYLSSQLITYIGNKRAVLGHISLAVEKVKQRLGKSRLDVLDAFSGSGVVSRFLKGHCNLLVSNDIEDYAAVVARCYLRNKNSIEFKTICDIIASLNSSVDQTGFPPGFIEEMYSPVDEARISVSDRVFYTRSNARRIDNYRRLIGQIDAEYRDYLLGPLLSEASIHANTAGVFKGFYKDRHTKIGKYGGSNSDALLRIKGDIRLSPPILSNYDCEVIVHQSNANDLPKVLPSLDFAYLDPPYNQHPYGSNYFMLNLIVRYQRPSLTSKVSGIPPNWRRSPYNVRSQCLPHFKSLVHSLDSKFLLISFNNEGFISPEQMHDMLSPLGPVEIIEIPYNTFRGSRNLRSRSIHVTEHLFLLERR